MNATDAKTQYTEYRKTNHRWYYSIEAVKTHKFYQRSLLLAKEIEWIEWIVVCVWYVWLLSEIVYVQMHQIRSHLFYISNFTVFATSIIFFFFLLYYIFSIVKRGEHSPTRDPINSMLCLPFIWHLGIREKKTPDCRHRMRDALVHHKISQTLIDFNAFW